MGKNWEVLVWKTPSSFVCFLLLTIVNYSSPSPDSCGASEALSSVVTVWRVYSYKIQKNNWSGLVFLFTPLAPGGIITRGAIPHWGHYHTNHILTLVALSQMICDSMYTLTPCGLNCSSSNWKIITSSNGKCIFNETFTLEGLRRDPGHFSWSPVHFIFPPSEQWQSHCSVTFTQLKSMHTAVHPHAHTHCYGHCVSFVPCISFIAEKI